MNPATNIGYAVMVSVTVWHTKRSLEAGDSIRACGVVRIICNLRGFRISRNYALEQL